jgi:hypothetical protein
MEESGQLHVPDALPQGNSPWYPLDRRLGGPQNHSERGGEESFSSIWLHNLYASLNVNTVIKSIRVILAAIVARNGGW